MATPAGVGVTGAVEGTAVDGTAVDGTAVYGTAALRAGESGTALLRAIERIEAEAILRLVDFDRADLTSFLGFTGPVRHLEIEGGLSRAQAVRLHHLVTHCRRFPLTAAALDGNDLTVPHLEVLARAARGLADEYGRDEPELLAMVDGRDLATFERALSNWRHRNDVSIEEVERRFEQRAFSSQRAFDGSGHGSFQLDAIGMDIVEAALETPPDSARSMAPCRSRKQRRADAFVDMADCYLTGVDPRRHDQGRGSEPRGAVSGTRTTVDVVIDLATLERREPARVSAIRAELATGAAIPLPLVDQLLCDAGYRRLVMEGPSVVLDYGTATPAIPVALRRAIQRRDQRCTFSGCDRSWSWCDVHHLVPRRSGGSTDERNLALVCRFHHSLIHQAGWTLERDPTTGQLHTSSP